jgi:hypothetical protein
MHQDTGADQREAPVYVTLTPDDHAQERVREPKPGGLYFGVKQQVDAMTVIASDPTASSSARSRVPESG